MGMTPNEYLHQALAAVIAGNEEATIITTDGQLACGEFLWNRRTRMSRPD
jgi:hypothetical protein